MSITFLPITQATVVDIYAERTANATVALAVLTGLLFAVTAVLARYTYKLWLETKQVRENASSEATRQSELTREAIGQATRSADVAERSLDRARVADEHLLRAYVVLETISRYENKPEWPATAGYVLSLRNVGRTPANDLAIRAMTNVLPVESAEFASLPMEDERGSLGPRASRTLFVEPLEIEPAFLEAIQDGDYELYLWGRADYVDVFGREQFTEFRMVRKPGTQEFRLDYGGNVCS